MLACFEVLRRSVGFVVTDELKEGSWEAFHGTNTHTHAHTQTYTYNIMNATHRHLCIIS